MVLIAVTIIWQYIHVGDQWTKWRALDAPGIHLRAKVSCFQSEADSSIFIHAAVIFFSAAYSPQCMKNNSFCFSMLEWQGG